MAKVFYGTHMELGGDGGCNVVTTEGTEPREIEIPHSFPNRMCAWDHTHDVHYLYLHIEQIGFFRCVWFLCLSVFGPSCNSCGCVFFTHAPFLSVLTFPEERALWMALLFLSYLLIPPAPLPPPTDKEVIRDTVIIAVLLHSKVWFWPFWPSWIRDKIKPEKTNILSLCVL